MACINDAFRRVIRRLESEDHAEKTADAARDEVEEFAALPNCRFDPCFSLFPFFSTHPASPQFEGISVFSHFSASYTRVKVFCNKVKPRKLDNWAGSDCKDCWGQTGKNVDVEYVEKREKRIDLSESRDWSCVSSDGV
jgi:hypothetical protein